MPGPVRAIMVSPIKGGLRVAWTAPSPTTGGVVRGYEYRTANSLWVKTTRMTTSVTGLRPKRAVSVSVRAYNDAGFGPAVSVRGIPK